MALTPYEARLGHGTFTYMRRLSVEFQKYKFNSHMGYFLFLAPLLRTTLNERLYTGSTRVWLDCRALELLANTMIMTICQKLVSLLATLQAAKAADVLGNLL